MAPRGVLYQFSPVHATGRNYIFVPSSLNWSIAKLILLSSTIRTHTHTQPRALASIHIQTLLLKKWKNNMPTFTKRCSCHAIKHNHKQTQTFGKPLAHFKWRTSFLLTVTGNTRKWRRKLLEVVWLKKKRKKGSIFFVPSFNKLAYILTQYKSNFEATQGYMARWWVEARRSTNSLVSIKLQVNSVANSTPNVNHRV